VFIGDAFRRVQPACLPAQQGGKAAPPIIVVAINALAMHCMGICLISALASGMGKAI
jgi:hypothetical protein